MISHNELATLATRSRHSDFNKDGDSLSQCTSVSRFALHIHDLVLVVYTIPFLFLTHPGVACMMDIMRAWFIWIYNFVAGWNGLKGTFLVDGCWIYPNFKACMLLWSMGHGQKANAHYLMYIMYVNTKIFTVTQSKLFLSDV